MGGVIASSAGFPFLMRVVGVTNILVAPVCLYLRDVPLHTEHRVGLQMFEPRLYDRFA